REQKALIDNEAHERTIGAYLAGYLRSLFPDWNVDPEYNREGADQQPKGDAEGNLIPDIVIHTRLVKLGPNLVAIEMKGHWNDEDRAVDEQKLRRIRAEYGYQFLYRIELGPDEAALIPVDQL